MTDVRVLIAEDSPRVRASLRLLVLGTPGLALAGEAGDGLQAVEAARTRAPDVVLLDVQMPHLDGISAAGQIAAAAPGVRIIVLTTFDSDDYLYASLEAGVAGFLLKNSAPETLVSAIRSVHAGGGILAPEVTSRVLDSFSRTRSGRLSPALPVDVVISERELEVTGLLARGLSNGEIAQDLGLSTETVKTYVSRLLARLGLRDRTQLAVFAVEKGLLT